MSNTVKAPALIHCNCTTGITGNKADESNFEIYRYLDVDEDGDRNIFCGDQPFLFSDDCKPYINIKKGFPCCKSKYYGTALESLIACLENKQVRLIKERASESEILDVGIELTSLYGPLSSYIDKKTLKDKYKSYTCLLQVVDRWFRTSTKAIVNDHFSGSQKMLGEIELLDKNFRQIVKSARENTRSLKTWNDVGDGLTEVRNRMSKLSVFHTFSFANKRFSSFFIVWETEKKLKWFNERMDELEEVLEKCEEMLHDEAFFATSQAFTDSRMDDIKALFFIFYDAMAKLTYEDKVKYKDSLNSLKLRLMYSSSNEDRFQEKEFLQDNSFLVCRCGGIISIVYDGEQLRQYTDKIYPNIVKLLKQAEKELHERLFNYDLEPVLEIMLSLIDGFNFVRNALLELGEDSQYEQPLVPVANGKIQTGFGTNMIIGMRSRSEINKKAHNKAARNIIYEFAFDKALGGLGKVGTAISIAITGAKAVIEPNAENITSATGKGVEVYGAAAENTVAESAGKVVGALLDIKSIVEVIGHLSYFSVADYIGEIQITLQVGTHDIIYTGSYDIEGTQINDDAKPNYIENSSPIVHRDNQGLAYTEGKKWNTKEYENKINLDYSLIVNGKKFKGKVSDVDLKEWVENELEQMNTEVED